MDKDTGPRREPEPDNLLRVCAALLALRDFTSCRELARRVPRSDQKTSVCVDRILAIADVLDAAERRLGNNHFDWCAILQLRRDDAGNRALTRRQFKKLVRLLDPNKNKFSFSDDALMRVREAWFVLSDPGRRARYEREIKPQEPCKQRSGGGDAPNKGNNKNGGDPNVTFWTLCPYCWNLYEYEKKYEDCSLRCENCRKTFHGVAVKPPVPEMVVEGKQQYYCYHVSLPLRYPVERQRGMKDKNMGEQRFVYMSDDDVHDSSKERGFRAEEGGGGGAAMKAGNEGVRVVLEKNVGESEGFQGNGRTELQSNGKRRMRFKTVAACRTKKIVGKRIRSQGYLDPNSDSDLDSHDGELEFTGDGDIFVGVRLGK